MIKTTAIATLVVARAFVAGDAVPPESVPACELVDLAAAEKILGAGATNTDGGAQPTTCMYQAPGGWAVMSIQVQSADMYDVIAIQQPHTALDVGDRGRYHVNENGVVSVQFATGDFSVTMGVTPILDPPHEFMDALFEVAGEAAAKIP